MASRDSPPDRATSGITSTLTPFTSRYSPGIKETSSTTDMSTTPAPVACSQHTPPAKSISIEESGIAGSEHLSGSTSVVVGNSAPRLRILGADRHTHNNESGGSSDDSDIFKMDGDSSTPEEEKVKPKPPSSHSPPTSDTDSTLVSTSPELSTEQPQPQKTEGEQLPHPIQEDLEPQLELSKRCLRTYSAVLLRKDLAVCISGNVMPLEPFRVDMESKFELEVKPTIKRFNTSAVKSLMMEAYFILPTKRKQRQELQHLLKGYDRCTIRMKVKAIDPHCGMIARNVSDEAILTKNSGVQYLKIPELVSHDAILYKSESDFIEIRMRVELRLYIKKMHQVYVHADELIEVLPG